MGSISEKEADEAIQRGDFQFGIPFHLDILEKEPENALAMYHLSNDTEK